MKLRTLRKKICRLEKRLREGPKKLSKLRQKLEAMETAKKIVAAQRKPAAVARKKAAAAQPIAPKAVAKSVPVQKATAPKKVKKKLNISPERRAQLAAAMKARWAAKRAAAAMNSQPAAPDLDLGVQEVAPLT